MSDIVRSLIQRISSHQEYDAAEMRACFHEIMSGHVSPTRISVAS